VSFAAKWDATSFAFHHTPVRCPAPVGESLAGRIRQVALAAWQVIGCRGYARVDIRVNAQDQPHVIEVNCNPDLSPEAGFFRAIAAAGYSYPAMVERIVALADHRSR
jgi:D-alanine-D-alanine ligase